MAKKATRRLSNELAEETARTFSEIYEQAKARIFAKVLAHARKYPNSPYSGRPLVSLEKALRAEYDKLGIDLGDKFQSALPAVMKDFYTIAAEDMKKTSKVVGKIDTGRIDYFVKDSLESIAGATTRMKASHVRELRKISAEVFRQASLTGDTRKQVSKTLLERAMNIPGWEFIDNAGSKWDSKNYFDMLARTQLMEAGRQSYLDHCAQNDCDVVVISTSGGSCPKCTPWEGRLVSISGATPGLPTLEDARASGLFHPNCTHSFTAVPDVIREMDYDEKGYPK